MPIVPFTNRPGAQRPALPAPDDPWVLMAAATMDQEGRLITQEPKEPPKVGDNTNGS